MKIVDFTEHFCSIANLMGRIVSLYFVIDDCRVYFKFEN